MTMERLQNSLDGNILGGSQEIFEEDLVFPENTLEEIGAASDMISAADILTTLGIGFFRISEKDFDDPDGTRVHYAGDRNFTDFTDLAYAFTQEVKRCKDVFEAARIAELKHPKSPPKTQGIS